MIIPSSTWHEAVRRNPTSRTSGVAHLKFASIRGVDRVNGSEQIITPRSTSCRVAARPSGEIVDRFLDVLAHGAASLSRMDDVAAAAPVGLLWRAPTTI